jgi:hypothetical protein
MVATTGELHLRLEPSPAVDCESATSYCNSGSAQVVRQKHETECSSRTPEVLLAVVPVPDAGLEPVGSRLLLPALHLVGSARLPWIGGQ